MKFKVLFISLLAASLAHSATITVSNVDFTLTNAVVNSGGTIYPLSSGYIGIGTFSLTDGQISGATSAATLVGGFTLFGTSNVFGAGFNIAGTYQFESIGAITGAPYTGPIYTFITNNAILANATEFLVYKHDATFNLDPASSGPVTLKDSLNAGTLLLGGFGTYQADIGLGSANAYNTVTLIPEPSTFLLASLGVLGLLRRRR